MPRYQFTGDAPATLSGVPEGTDTHTVYEGEPGHNSPFVAPIPGPRPPTVIAGPLGVVVAHPGVVIETSAPYEHPLLELISEEA